MFFRAISSSYPIFTLEFKCPDYHIIHSLLDRCSTMDHAYQIHAQILINGLCDETLTLGKLIAFCTTSVVGNLSYAHFVFDHTQRTSRFMLNNLIRGYSNSDNPRQGLLLYRQMLNAGYLPNDFTFPFVLKSCAAALTFVEALIVHAQIIKLGFVCHVYTQNSLLHVYAICGHFALSRLVFDDIPDKNIVSWNSIIGACSTIACCKASLSVFQLMRDSGLFPDGFTFVSLLTVCSQTGNSDMGRFFHLYAVIMGQIHDLIVQNALLDMYIKCGCLPSARNMFEKMPHKNVVTWTSMVSGYAKHGLLTHSRQAFDQMTNRNVVSWNSMISSYIHHGYCREALNLFKEMQSSTEKPDEATVIGVLATCSIIGDMITGRKIHSYILSHSILLSTAISNALMDMYAKCGSLSTALDLFHKISKKNIISWNVIIGAFAMHGRAQDAVIFLAKMEVCGVSPDSITSVNVLSACSHDGLLYFGRCYFDAMNRVYGIQHEIQHYACMVDLLGRAGYLVEAVVMIGNMPMKPDAVVWGALLGACRVHGNVGITRQVLKQILESSFFITGIYVLMSNILFDANRWNDVKHVRKLMKDKWFRKGKALSSIEIDGNIHDFLVGDSRHDFSNSIYSMLDGLTSHMRSEGYLPSSLKEFFADEE